MAGFTEFRIDNESNTRMICFYSTLYYKLSDTSTLSIEQEAAWCEQCRSFGLAENVPSVGELHERFQELQTPSQKHYFVYRSDESIQTAIDELRIRLKWRESRESPARCLTCGSTNFVPIRFGDDRSCMVNGKRLVEVGFGFADTADWIAEFSSEGLAIT